ncbi:MAG TPA: hypothetical protein VNO32_63980, partial [Candidatus Acidoferrum sp.]|nr:hypothetical protein [Candidatus Acidoferrum sp.]
MTGTAIQNEVSRDTWTSRSVRSFALRLVATTIALIIWFWTQSLIGARSVPNAGIGDRLHTVTTSANSYL